MKNNKQNNKQNNNDKEISEKTTGKGKEEKKKKEEEKGEEKKKTKTKNKKDEELDYPYADDSEEASDLEEESNNKEENHEKFEKQPKIEEKILLNEPTEKSVKIKKIEIRNKEKKYTKEFSRGNITPVLDISSSNFSQSSQPNQQNGNILIRFGFTIPPNAQLSLQQKENTQEESKHIIFVVDTSGSMEGCNKLTNVQKALLQIVNGLKGTVKITLISFDSEAQTLLSKLELNKNNKTTIINKINSMQAGGYTNIENGLEEIYKESESNEESKGTQKKKKNSKEKTIVYLFSDGANYHQNAEKLNKLKNDLPSRREKIVKKLKKLYSSNGNELTFKCFGIGTDWDSEELNYYSFATNQATDPIIDPNDVFVVIEQLLAVLNGASFNATMEIGVKVNNTYTMVHTQSVGVVSLTDKRIVTTTINFALQKIIKKGSEPLNLKNLNLNNLNNNDNVKIKMRLWKDKNVCNKKLLVCSCSINNEGIQKLSQTANLEVICEYIHNKKADIIQSKKTPKEKTNELQLLDDSLPTKIFPTDSLEQKKILEIKEQIQQNIHTILFGEEKDRLRLQSLVVLSFRVPASSGLNYNGNNKIQQQSSEICDRNNFVDISSSIDKKYFSPFFTTSNQVKIFCEESTLLKSMQQTDNLYSQISSNTNLTNNNTSLLLQKLCNVMKDFFNTNFSGEYKEINLSYFVLNKKTYHLANSLIFAISLAQIGKSNFESINTYRTITYDGKQHSGVICVDKLGNLYFADPTHCKVFHLGNKKDLKINDTFQKTCKDAIDFYKNKNLNGFLLRLFRHHFKNDEFHLKDQHEQLLSTQELYNALFNGKIEDSNEKNRDLFEQIFFKLYSSGKEKSEDTLDQVKCPILREIMYNPVFILGKKDNKIFISPHAYEYDAINCWIQENRTDPFTGTKYDEIKLYSAKELANKIYYVLLSIAAGVKESSKIFNKNENNEVFKKKLNEKEISEDVSEEKKNKSKIQEVVFKKKHIEKKIKSFNKRLLSTKKWKKLNSMHEVTTKEEIEMSCQSFDISTTTTTTTNTLNNILPQEKPLYKCNLYLVETSQLTIDKLYSLHTSQLTIDKLYSLHTSQSKIVTVKYPWFKNLQQIQKSYVLNVVYNSSDVRKTACLYWVNMNKEWCPCFPTLEETTEQQLNKLLQELLLDVIALKLNNSQQEKNENENVKSVVPISFTLNQKQIKQLESNITTMKGGTPQANLYLYMFETDRVVDFSERETVSRTPSTIFLETFVAKKTFVGSGYIDNKLTEEYLAEFKLIKKRFGTTEITDDESCKKNIKLLCTIINEHFATNFLGQYKFITSKYLTTFLYNNEFFLPLIKVLAFASIQTWQINPQQIYRSFANDGKLQHCALFVSLEHTTYLVDITYNMCFTIRHRQQNIDVPNKKECNEAMQFYHNKGLTGFLDVYFSRFFFLHPDLQSSAPQLMAHKLHTIILHDKEKKQRFKKTLRNKSSDGTAKDTICPIKRKTMLDPVILLWREKTNDSKYIYKRSARSYEREFLEAWLEQSTTDPVSENNFSKGDYLVIPDNKRRLFINQSLFLTYKEDMEIFKKKNDYEKIPNFNEKNIDEHKKEIETKIKFFKKRKSEKQVTEADSLSENEEAAAEELFKNPPKIEKMPEKIVVYNNSTSTIFPHANSKNKKSDNNSSSNNSNLNNNNNSDSNDNGGFFKKLLMLGSYPGDN